MTTKSLAIAAIGGSVEPHACRLTFPPDAQLLYKVMTVENLLRSVAGSYLHFNRVDAYSDRGADPCDGQQLPNDREGNSRAKFDKSPEFSMANYYGQSRGRTYACCFSLENSEFIWKNYANGSVRGKVCIVFDSAKLRQTLNLTLQPGNAALQVGSICCAQIFSIDYGVVEYVDRATYKAPRSFYLNPIEYTYLKDKQRYHKDKEFRVSLSALGIGEFVIGDKKLEFPTDLQMAFDFKERIHDGTIKEILFAPGSDQQFLKTELNKLGILSYDPNGTADRPF